MICEKRQQYIRPKQLVEKRKLYLEDLTRLIQNNPDPRELKRALAVQMAIQGYAYHEIRSVLKVSLGFISKWKLIYQEQGANGLTLKHPGPASSLSPMQRQAAIAWLQHKNTWNLVEFQQYIKDTYDVVFASKQSYYSLFKEAGIVWKKGKRESRTKAAF